MLQQILRLDGFIQHIYMAVYPDKILLLDGCCRSDVDLVLNTIRHTLGRDVDQLKAVLVTHMHADHAGGATFLRKITGCSIISANKPNQWYAGIRGRSAYLVDLSLSYFVSYRQGNSLQNMNYPSQLDADLVVNDGDSVPMFDDWQIIETSGHTDRDLSVYHHLTGKVYVADLIIKLKGDKFVNPYNIHNPVAYQNSLKKIQVRNPSLVMMAHGGQSYINQSNFDKLIAMSPNKPRTYRHILSGIVIGLLNKKRRKR